MRDILPELVADAIRDRLISGVTLAEEGYVYSSADEDSLTGALGQSILAPRVTYIHDSGHYEWSLEYFKVRGRGKGAPEKETGADGIFQITVKDDLGGVLPTKGLPFQSKKNWHGKDSSLAKQARDLIAACGAGIVIDYTAVGYFATDVQDVIRASGDRRQVAASPGLGRLSIVLGTQFVDCSIGRIGLYYDREREQFVGADQQLPAPGVVIAAQVNVRRFQGGP